MENTHKNLSKRVSNGAQIDATLLRGSFSNNYPTCDEEKAFNHILQPENENGSLFQNVDSTTIKKRNSFKENAFTFVEAPKTKTSFQNVFK